VKTRGCGEPRWLRMPYMGRQQVIERIWRCWRSILGDSGEGLITQGVRDEIIDRAKAIEPTVSGDLAPQPDRLK
jgi:hypothetical protein